MKNKSRKEVLDSFKAETARELGIELNDGRATQLSAKQSGAIGGNMVKKMIAEYEKKLK